MIFKWYNLLNEIYFGEIKCKMKETGKITTETMYIFLLQHPRMHDSVSFINTHIQYLVCLLHLLFTSDQERSFITYGLIISCGKTFAISNIKNVIPVAPG